MAVVGVEIPRFTGLNLVLDPQEVGPSGAVDALNVIIDRSGILQSRSGYSAFSSSSGNYGRRMIPCYQTAGTVRLIVNPHGSITALKTDGTVDKTQAMTALGPVVTGAARFAAPGSEDVYLANGQESLWRWNGTAFSQPAITGATINGSLLGITPTDHRLACANFYTSSQYSRVRFSDPGDPLSFPTNNYVDIRPGDGESIQELVTWRDQLFVFKETSFAVFYGTSTAGDGTPIFNYRMVDAGVGCLYPSQAVAGRDGVYFVNQNGVYVTSGGPPKLVSQAIDPVFSGDLHSVAQLSQFNIGAKGVLDASAALHYYNDLLFLTLPTGAATKNNRVFVYDTRIDSWSVWDVPARGFVTFRAANTNELYFAEAATSGHVHKLSSAATTDAGTAIVSRWRSGFWTPGKPGSEAWVREWLLDGTGTVNFQTAVNDAAALGSAASIALGASVAQARDRRGLRGRNVSWQIGASSGEWSLSRLTALLWGQSALGAKAA